MKLQFLRLPSFGRGFLLKFFIRRLGGPTPPPGPSLLTCHPQASHPTQVALPFFFDFFPIPFLLATYNNSSLPHFHHVSCLYRFLAVTLCLHHRSGARRRPTTNQSRRGSKKDDRTVPHGSSARAPPSFISSQLCIVGACQSIQSQKCTTASWSKFSVGGGW